MGQTNFKQNLLFKSFQVLLLLKAFSHMSGQCSAIYKLFIAPLKIKILWTKNLPGDKQSLRALDYIKIYLPERKKKRKIKLVSIGFYRQYIKKTKINLKIIRTHFLFLFQFIFFVVSIKLLPLEASTTPKENLFTM